MSATSVCAGEWLQRSVVQRQARPAPAPAPAPGNAPGVLRSKGDFCCAGEPGGSRRCSRLPRPRSRIDPAESPAPGAGEGGVWLLPTLRMGS